MWAVVGLPVYPAAERAPRRPSRKSSKSIDVPNPSHEPSANSLLPPPPPPPSQPQHAPAASTGQLATHVADLFEPAVDGPPSPESIRALNRQMQHSSALDGHPSHQTTSSASSSLRSLTSGGDRPSWENALEGMSLSRKSSGRSTSSSMPTRDRPESVQIFGKSIFSRRGRLRRESSAQNSAQNSTQNSSNSSLNLGDAAWDGGPPPTSAPSAKGPAASGGIFGRRRGTRSESTDDSATRKKFQISGPYNFQHVTHTQRENVPSLMHHPPAHGPAQGYEISQLRVSQPPAGPMRGIHSGEMRFSRRPSDALPLDEDGDVSPRSKPVFRSRSQRRPPPLTSQVPTSPPQRRSPRHSRSQVPPPRPPRSPAEGEFAPAAPVPPPRISSRASIRYDGFDPLASADLDRPQTSGGFRQPRPLTFRFSPDASPPATSHGYVPKTSLDTLTEQVSPRSPNPPEDVDWPLPNPSNAQIDAPFPLPGVPEEIEGAGAASVLAHRSRLSAASNTSSLRGSQSVPLLRQPCLPRAAVENRRRSSGASETLGRFDLFAAQRALKFAEVEDEEEYEEPAASEPARRMTWEDDIDYCYEHAVEADCEYAWERPSLDFTREPDDAAEAGAGALPPSNRASRGHSEVSPSLLSPGQFDVPALSPASQASTTTIQEAITPTVSIVPKAASSNFSLPRAEPCRPVQRLLHVRNPSEASSFKESHGFNLSPSLLIPGDYRHQMMLASREAEEPRDLDHDLIYRAPYEEPPLTMDTSTLLINSRISASTTMSNDTDRSTSERHISTTSASTDFTRLTMSTSSLDMENFIPKNEVVEATPRIEESDLFHSRAKSQGMMPILRESDADQTVTAIRRDATHGSDPNLVGLAAREGAAVRAGPPNSKRKDPLLTRRRARTTSLSTPPPPGQYALFPSVQMTGSRI